MEEVYKDPNTNGKLYVGNDTDVPKAKEKDFSICSCCKEGPNGHRSMLGYRTQGAPKDKEYLFARRGKHFVLNLIDVDDPAYVPDKAVQAAFDFITERLKAGDKVLVHCNHGHSRGPSIAMMYLRHIGDLPDRFRAAQKIFKTFYSNYKPAMGMAQYSKSHWSSLKKD